MQPKRLFGLSCLICLNLSSIAALLFALYSPSSINPVLGLVLSLMMVPTLIITWTAAFTVTSFGIISIIGFASLYELIHYCMSIKDQELGESFTIAIISSFIIAFITGFYATIIVTLSAII